MKKLLREFARKYGILALWYLLRPANALKERGWDRSVACHLPVDKKGMPLPWYTYPAISFLERCNLGGLNVFEYGTGNSTLWWLSRGAKVACCDHENVFWELAQRRVGDKALFVGCYQDVDQYVAACLQSGEHYDLVVVDGVWRNECLPTALRCLSERGVLVLDNAEREEYSTGRAMLLERGFRELSFVGMGPINHYEWVTSVFYRDGNCLGI